MATLSRQIRTSGRSEREWSDSAMWQGVEVRTARAFLRGVSRLVVVAPHPDDEVLGAGGLLRLAHHVGISTHLVLATDGEASHIGSRTLSRVQLRYARVRESSNAFELLGGDITRIARLRFADGKLAQDESDLVLALSGMVEPGDLVLTTWWKDGHPDHEACGRAIRKVCRRAQTRSAFFPVWSWNWARPGRCDLPLERAVRVPLTPMARLAKRCALSCFETQRTRDPDVADTPILSNDTIAYFERAFETFICG